MFLKLEGQGHFINFMPTRSNSKPTINMRYILHVLSSESLVKGTHLIYIIQVAVIPNTIFQIIAGPDIPFLKGFLVKFSKRAAKRVFGVRF